MQLQLINELVGAAGDEEQKPTVEVKHNDSHTTNHSTGDSQNSSSSAEKARQEEEAESSSDSEEAGCVPNESLKSFITGSPFSFRNPIFFSMPRDH